MYAAELRRTVQKAPKTLGNLLGREALRLDFSVLRVAKYTGATRPTVYAWFKGGQVTPAYRTRVKGLISILRAAKTSDDAWKKACQLQTLQSLHEQEQ
jgi:hypothetical protein